MLMLDLSLEDYLEFHCIYLLDQIPQKPFFSWVAANGDIGVCFDSGPRGHSRSVLEAALAKFTAVRYAVIRRDGAAYQVTAGDRERTLFAEYDVVRDYKGKIGQLVRRPPGSAPAATDDRYVDLLVTRHG